MKTATFIATILAVIGTASSTAEAKRAGIFDTDRELHRLTNCPTFMERYAERDAVAEEDFEGCLLYTSPSPRDATLSRMPSSA